MDEIKKPLDEVYFFWIERALKAFRQEKNRVFSELGVNLTSDQWIVLKRIHESPGIHQKEIAALTYKDPASITRIIDLLMKHRLAERKPHKSDRRYYSMFLTEEGHELVERLLPIAVKMRRKGLEGVSEADQQAMQRALNQIADNFTS